MISPLNVQLTCSSVPTHSEIFTPESVLKKQRSKAEAEKVSKAATAELAKVSTICFIY